MTRNLRIGLLTMASAAALATPVALAVSCGNGDDNGNSSTTFDVGMEVAYAPYNFSITNEQYNSIVKGHPEYEAMVAPVQGGGYGGGYDVYVSNMIAAELGQTTLLHASEWDSLIPSLTQKNSFDAIIAGMSQNEEKEQVVDFTNPYFNPQNGILYIGDTAPTAARVAHAKIAAQRDTSWVGIADSLTDENITESDNADLAELSLINGRVNYVVTENTRGLATLEIHAGDPDWSNVHFYLPTAGQELYDGLNPEVDNICAAFPENTTEEYMANINRILSEFTATERSHILEVSTNLSVEIAGN